MCRPDAFSGFFANTRSRLARKRWIFFSVSDTAGSNRLSWRASAWLTKAFALYSGCHTRSLANELCCCSATIVVHGASANTLIVETNCFLSKPMRKSIHNWALIGSSGMGESQRSFKFCSTSPRAKRHGNSAAGCSTRRQNTW